MIYVIVPVFNAEATLTRCIDSVINQTYKEWKLILIDDGSTDSSFSIMKQYESDKILVIHKENEGAGIARNKGLDIIKKDSYVVFLDSDDYIENFYFEELANHNEDIVFIDVIRRNNNGKIEKKEIISDKIKKGKNYILRNQMTGKIPWGGVRKAVKSNIIIDNKIRYSHHKIGEEAIYSFLVLYYSNSFGCINGGVYNYITHSDSLSNTPIPDPWGPVALALKEKLIDMNIYDCYKSTINSFFYTALAVNIKRIAVSASYKDFKYECLECEKKYLLLIDDEKIYDTHSMMKKAKIVLFLLKRRMFHVLYYICKV